MKKFQISQFAILLAATGALAVGEIGQQIGAFIVNSLRSQPLTAEVPIAADIHARAAGTR